jgi:hypothetical protein
MYFSAAVLEPLIFKTAVIQENEANLGLQNYAVIMPIENKLYQI